MYNIVEYTSKQLIELGINQLLNDLINCLITYFLAQKFKYFKNLHIFERITNQKVDFGN